MKSHLKTVGKTYFQHLRQAWNYGFRMIGGGFICLWHGICPEYCTDTASNCVKALMFDMTGRRTNYLTDEEFDAMRREVLKHDFMKD